MSDTQKRITNLETLLRLGNSLRTQRESRGLSQGKVRGMRQATISRIERGGDVTLDTLISYAGALGLALALVPLGSEIGSGLALKRTPLPADGLAHLDLLQAFSDLRDDEP